MSEFLYVDDMTDGAVIVTSITEISCLLYKKYAETVTAPTHVV